MKKFHATFILQFNRTIPKLGNNKSKIVFYLQRTLHFDESYSDPEDTSL